GYDRIYDIAIAPDSTIWFGHGAGDDEATVALSIFDGDSQWRLINRSDAGVSLTENRCYAIAFGASGTAWLGLKSDGIFEFDYNGTPFIADDDTWERHERDFNLIYACSGASHPNGDVWFGHSAPTGVASGQGATRYVASSDTLINYPMPNNEAEDVLSRIRSIVVDSQGVVWLGAKGGTDFGSSGLWRFDPEEDEAPVNVYRQTEADAAADDDDNFINKVAIDEANKVIWLATDFYSADLEIYGVVKIEGLYEPKEDTTSSAIGDGTTAPSGFSLAQNYPNPFNPETAIDYSLDKSGQIRLSVYSITGGLIRTLDAGYRQVGTYTAMWDGRDMDGRLVGSGVYIYQLTSEQGFRIMKKAVLLK
ncbi:MAG: T9SS type A sorting domain-containing protein, partial [Fidelibacterota bacterium]